VAGFIRAVVYPAFAGGVGIATEYELISRFTGVTVKSLDCIVPVTLITRNVRTFPDVDCVAMLPLRASVIVGNAR
jgi:hypothetical protein